MKIVVPLTPDALARVDKLDTMIAKLEHSLPTLNRGDRHACEKTIATLHHKLNKECIDALLREKGIAPVRGKTAAFGYKVRRDDEGKVNAVVWSP
jgi:hypothetical protein